MIQKSVSLSLCMFPFTGQFLLPVCCGEGRATASEKVSSTIFRLSPYISLNPVWVMISLAFHIPLLRNMSLLAQSCMSSGKFYALTESKKFVNFWHIVNHSPPLFMLSMVQSYFLLWVKYWDYY